MSGMQKIKNSKITIRLALLVFCLAFSGIVLVYSGSNEGDTGGGSAGSCSGSGPCFTQAYWGMRVALVYDDGHGQTVRANGSRVIDIYQSPDGKSGDKRPGVEAGKKLTMYDGNKNLKHEIHGVPKDPVKTGKNFAEYVAAGDFMWVSTVAQYYSENFAKIFANDYRSSGAAANFASGIRQYDQYMTGLKNAGAEGPEIQKILNMFYYSEKTWEQLVAENGTWKYWIQFEPLLYVTVYNGGLETQALYGTVTEIAYMTGITTIPDVVLNYTKAGLRIATAPFPAKYKVASSNSPGAADIRSDMGAGVAHLWVDNWVPKNQITCRVAVENIKSYSPNVDADIAALKTQQPFYLYQAYNTKSEIDFAQLGPTEVTYDGLNPAKYKDPAVVARYISSGKAPAGYVSGPFCDNDTPVTVTVCSPDVNLDDCETGISWFRDASNENDWLVNKCAYTDPNGETRTSDNTGHIAGDVYGPDDENNDGLVGNTDYCEVFCYEEVETSFPTKVYNVKAGQTFVWGGTDGRFGTIKIKKHCSTQDYVYGSKGYRFVEWNEDYYANQKSMIGNHLQGHVKLWSNNTAYATSYYGASCGCFGSYACGDHYHCNSGTLYKGIRNGYTLSYGGDSWMESISKSSTSTTSSGHCSAAAAIAAVQYPSSEITGPLATSAANKVEEPKLLTLIRQCYSNIKYVYDATLTFVFKEPENAAYGANTRSFGSTNSYKWEMEIEPDKTDGYNKVNFNAAAGNCSWKTVYTYNCTPSASSAKCVIETTERVLDCNKGVWDIEGEWEYSYPVEEFQWYSLKTDNTLLNKSERDGYSHLDDAYFYSIGFGLPTAFSLTDGNYYMTMVVENLGDNGAPLFPNADRGHFWPLATNLSELTSADVGGVNEALGFDGYGLAYKCTYEVTNEVFAYECEYPEGSSAELTAESPIYCDPTKDDESNGRMEKVDIAYRLVQLLKDSDPISVAFPGRTGGGREIGSNWNTDEATIREILDINIYDQSMAMYEIMLDVNAIQRIRQSNNQYEGSGKDPYSSYFDAGGNLKIICINDPVGDDKSKYCASTFITWLNTGGEFNYPLLGTCLPPGTEQERAREILANGCNVSYDYSPYYSGMWVR